MRDRISVLFIVNQSKESIYGRRIRNFAKYFTKISGYKIIYRGNKAKIRSIFYFLKEIITSKPKVVYLEQIAYSGCTAVFLAKLFHRFKYVFCISDAYAELIRSRHSKLTAFLAAYFESLWINVADYLLAWNPLHADWLKNKYKKTQVGSIEHGVEIDIFKPSEEKKLRYQLGLDNSLVIGLIGSLNWSRRYKFCYGWDLIEALSYIRELDVKALIVGEGSGLPYLKQMVKDYNLEGKVIFTAGVAYEEIPRYINCMDICICTQSNDLAGFIKCPTKLSEYMACGKYIISSDVGYAKLYVDKTGSLLFYSGIKDNDYPKRLSVELRRIYYERGALEKGKFGISIAREKLDNMILSGKLEQILFNLINPKEV